MTNYIVLHYYANALILRTDFGNDINAAYGHANEIIANLYQLGTHTIMIMDEFSGEVIEEFER